MDFLKKTFAEFSKDRCTTLAAALAYYTAFALPPLMYLLLTPDVIVSGIPFSSLQPALAKTITQSIHEAL